MTARHTAHPPAATCTFALRLADGRYVSDPAGITGSYSLDNAYLWLWPLEGDEARAERVAAVVRRYPWIGKVTVVRGRA